MKTKHILMTFALLLSTTFLNATVYEDGTNATNSWSVYDNTPTGASITSIYDAEKASDVIKLEGDASKNGYMLGSWSGTNAWNNTTEKTLTWSMNYSEDYYIFVSMQTTKGHRYLYYSNAEDDIGLFNKQFIHHGLGAESKNGTWQTLSRDLEADLKEYESDNSIVSVNAILVRGSGLFDDIELKNNTEVNELMTYYTVESIVSPSLDTHVHIYKNNLGNKTKLVQLFDYINNNTRHYGADNLETITINGITYMLISFSYTNRHMSSVYGVGLWKTDGTVAGTILLKTFTTHYSTAGYFSLSPRFTNTKNGKIYIMYKEDIYDYDYNAIDVTYLWETNGTEAGTVEIERIIKPT